MFEINTYVRKTFEIDAVQVDEDNYSDVAEWCGGELRFTTTELLAGDNEQITERESVPYVKVRVFRPLNERQTRAYVGDWVLYAGTGYKVYTRKAFEKSFDLLSGVAADQAVQAEKTQPDS
jgi:hypothetical protein